jgi:hypothetical protein
LLLYSSYLLLGFPTGRSSTSTPHRNQRLPVPSPKVHSYSMTQRNI